MFYIYRNMLYVAWECPSARRVHKLLTYIISVGVLRNNTEANDEPVGDRSWHHVQLARRVDVSQQLLVQLVYLRYRVLGIPHQAETHQAQLQSTGFNKL